MPQTLYGRSWPAAGDQMTFLDANGHDWQKEEARKFFVKDQILVVKDIQIGDWSSSIEFVERPGMRFNSVMFEMLGDDVKPEAEPEMPMTLTVSREEHSMILAALRLWTDVVNDGGEYINEGLIEIATNGDQHAMLDDGAIDALCERINA